jgi:CRP-like cAMP-binding protein
MSADRSDLRSLVRKLESVHPLTADEKQALLDLPIQVRDLDAGQDIVREGDRPSRCCLVLDGFAQRYKIVGDGRRQIMSFHIPGDMPDILSLHMAVMDHSLGILSRSRVGFISHESLREVIRRHPRVESALWRDTLVDAAIFREWMVGIGRRDARARIAHLLCELVTRMELVGRTESKSVQTPLTQNNIADALGLSTEHVNRVVQELRAANLITWQGRTLAINDWDGLKEVGEFDPAYLYLSQEQPP